MGNCNVSTLGTRTKAGQCSVEKRGEERRGEEGEGAVKQSAVQVQYEQSGEEHSVRLTCLSQSAWTRMSQRRTVPLEEANANMPQHDGWNSAAVITSVRSSMFGGFMSTMSARPGETSRCDTRALCIC